VVPVVAGAVSSTIIPRGATVKTASRNGVKGYYVYPNAAQVELVLMGKDSKGNTKSYGKYSYQVKSFPPPRLNQSSIRKNETTTLTASLGPESVVKAEFVVTRFAITIGSDLIQKSGNKITPADLAKAKSGRDIAIKIWAKRVGGDEVMVPASVLVN
jgi:hypothetical protein